MPPPGGNVTFLFTDIERSSQLWETHPRTMGRSLAQHDDLIRATVDEHGGYIFKTIGDAFCVVFESTLDAVQAAIVAQRRLSSAAWEETGPLRVRMALHSSLSPSNSPRRGSRCSPSSKSSPGWMTASAC